LKYRTAFPFAFILLLFQGCSHIPTPVERYNTLNTLANEQNLSIETLHTTHFDLTSIVTNRCEARSMRVYIEGDGLAWMTRSRLSDNPTPINPLAAKLMLQDKSECKAYIARPCQYQQSKECHERYWSSARFSDEVIQSYDEALDALKKQYSISSFTLIGYSGGGAVAGLEASRRDDVKMLITIAGNLDTQKWTSLHNITSLHESLNPADFSPSLSDIDQLHVIGAKDTVIPQEIFQSYKSHFKDAKNIKSIICDECTHNNGWEKVWAELQ
jgi:hypothetical protein